MECNKKIYNCMLCVHVIWKFIFPAVRISHSHMRTKDLPTHPLIIYLCCPA